MTMPLWYNVAAVQCVAVCWVPNAVSLFHAADSMLCPLKIHRLVSRAVIVISKIRVKTTQQEGTWAARQFLSCALVCGRGIVFCHYYQSMAKSAGKDFRDGAAVPFE